MPHCYIIYSEALGKHYIGACRESVETRLIAHNSNKYGMQRFTSTTNDWEIVLTIPVDTFDHAVRIERWIKRMKSKQYILNLMKYPEMIEKLKTKTEHP